MKKIFSKEEINVETFRRDELNNLFQLFILTSNCTKDLKDNNYRIWLLGIYLLGVIDSILEELKYLEYDKDNNRSINGSLSLPHVQICSQLSSVKIEKKSFLPFIKSKEESIFGKSVVIDSFFSPQSKTDILSEMHNILPVRYDKKLNDDYQIIIPESEIVYSKIQSIFNLGRNDLTVFVEKVFKNVDLKGIKFDFKFLDEDIDNELKEYFDKIDEKIK